MSYMESPEVLGMQPCRPINLNNTNIMKTCKVFSNR